MKKCKDCKKEKPESDFYGLQGECKTCTKKRVRKNYSKNRSYYAEYDRKREKTAKRKTLKKIYYERLKLKNKGKYKARTKVGNAVRDKILKKLPCEICGDIKSQAHHPDYRRPLFVRWLCFKHHREIHGQKINL